MTEPMKTAIEYLAHELSIKTETIELNLHYTLTLDECQRVMESFAAQQVAQERDRIKKLAKETRDEETNSIWIPQLFELIDSL